MKYEIWVFKKIWVAAGFGRFWQGSISCLLANHACGKYPSQLMGLFFFLTFWTIFSLFPSKAVRYFLDQWKLQNLGLIVQNRWGAVAHFQSWKRAVSGMKLGLSGKCSDLSHWIHLSEGSEDKAGGKQRTVRTVTTWNVTSDEALCHWMLFTWVQLQISCSV